MSRVSATDVSESEIKKTRRKPEVAEPEDRRDRQRYKVSVPLILTIGDREIAAYTRDISNRGVYFNLPTGDYDLIGQDFEFVLELPPEITLSTVCRIRCRGRAVRTEEVVDGLSGVAAEIVNYTILGGTVAADHS